MNAHLRNCFGSMLMAACFVASSDAATAGTGTADECPIEFTVRDGKTGKLVPCRITIDNANGVPVRAAGQLEYRDRVVCVCDGVARLKLPPGRHTYEVERGPEYLPFSAMLRTQVGTGETKVAVTLNRAVDLAAEGWWSGDLHIHRPAEDMELLMRAEDLHVGSVLTWWHTHNGWKDKNPPADLLVRFDSDRYYHLMGGEDERAGGAVLFANLPRPLAIAEAGAEYPSSIQFITQAHTFPGAWVDMEKPFGWDAPLWLASGQIDSVGLAHANMCRDGMYRGGEEPGNCKPRDATRLPPPLGNGIWTLETYYHMLNCGFRIPPSAGSAAAGMPNPVGYNRVYVHVDGGMTYEKWWDAFRQGRCFVSNGPLLRCRAGGQLPGHIFKADEGAEVAVEVSLQLHSRDPIRTVEVVKDGHVERAVPFETAVAKGSLGRVTFKASGWFAVRAIAENAKTFRFAHTAPYFVEIGKTPRRVSKTSTEFFRDWTVERARRLGHVRDEVQRKELEELWVKTQRFWDDRLAQADAP